MQKLPNFTLEDMTQSLTWPNYCFFSPISLPFVDDIGIIITPKCNEMNRNEITYVKLFYKL